MLSQQDFKNYHFHYPDEENEVEAPTSSPAEQLQPVQIQPEPRS
ncbi:hypothetical protein [Streptococcus downei]|nr:hypothetical protein [Streptococcus downei]